MKLKRRLTIDKPKPIIQKIVLREEEQQEVKDILAGKPTKIMIERWEKRGTINVTKKTYRPGSMEGLNLFKLINLFLCAK
jgi:hypothetical protein